MSRMFRSIDSTWNVWVGCRFDCSYCNAKKAAETRLRHIPRYKDGFKPHLVDSELKRTFKPGQFIFVAYMGDIAFASSEARKAIVERIQQFPQTRFLFQSKDPLIFEGVGYPKWDNLVFGTTIETNRDYKLTKAPPPYDRYRSMVWQEHPHKFISIEPIMDFDLEVLLRWMRSIRPEIIEVGADNYHNHLPEPPALKLRILLDHLKHICQNVIEKEGLNRLKEGGNRG